MTDDQDPGAKIFHNSFFQHLDHGPSIKKVLEFFSKNIRLRGDLLGRSLRYFTRLSKVKVPAPVMVHILRHFQ